MRPMGGLGGGLSRERGEGSAEEGEGSAEGGEGSAEGGEGSAEREGLQRRAPLENQVPV